MEKQEEAKRECSAIFNDVLNFVEQKINNLPQESTEEIEVLGKVHDVLAGQAQKLADETADDIAFLAEQLKALQQVNDVKDPAKSQELLNMLIDEDEEISDTEVFKKGVSEEAHESKASLQAMVQDVKDALDEGNFEDVQLLLEALLDEEDSFDDDDADEEEGDEDEEDDEELDEDRLAKVMMKMAGHEETAGHEEKEGDDCEEDGCCSTTEEGAAGGCSSGGCGSCATGCGTGADKGFDIFSFISKYDRELELDAQKEDKKPSSEHQA